MSRPVDFVDEDVVQAALGTLDLGAQQGFSPNVHRHEDIRVWQGMRKTIQPAHRLVCPGEKPDEGRVDGEGWLRRQWGRDERRVARRLADKAASARLRGRQAGLLVKRIRITSLLLPPYFNFRPQIKISGLTEAP